MQPALEVENDVDDASMSVPNRLSYFDEMALVARSVQGDLDSFNQLVLAYQSLAYNHALSILGDRHQAEDVTQEGFIKAFRYIGHFRGGSFRGWLLRIVTNTAYDLLRRSKRQPTVPLFPEDEHGHEIESPLWLADPALSLEAIAEQDELMSYVRQMIDELPGVYRSVINLVDMYELEYKEVAKILKVPVGTVKSRLARGRLQIREKLNRVIGEAMVTKSGVEIDPNRLVLPA
jgi:RNA polymerase sigma-70 factor (ECF subfamily)